jgi:ribosomal protein L29
MKIKELQQMNKAEITKLLTSLQEQSRDLGFKIHSREVKNNHMLANVKKDIARILTILKQEAK